MATDSEELTSDFAENETLIEHGKPFRHSDMARNKQPLAMSVLSPVVHLRLSIEVLLCGLLIGNLFVFFGRDPSSTIESLPSKQFLDKQYGRDIEYMSLDHQYDSLWLTEKSAHNGLVRMNPNDLDDEPEWGAIGMFHQLHCLTGIRMALQQAREGKDPGVDDKDDDHWPHCFWYLRQAILCHADNTLERPRDWKNVQQSNGTITTVRTGIIDGARDNRKCGDSEALYKLRVAHGAQVELARMKDWKASHGGV